MKQRLKVTVAAAASTLADAVAHAETITLNGASQFDETHAFTKTMRKFEELVKEYYQGPDELEFILHLNSELGLEKDDFAYRSQGISVDYAIVALSHMSTFSQKAALMDMPFLFRDLDRWNAVLDGDALAPIADDILERADVHLIGYAGGGTRNGAVVLGLRGRSEDWVRWLVHRRHHPKNAGDTAQGSNALESPNHGQGDRPCALDRASHPARIRLATASR